MTFRHRIIALLTAVAALLTVGTADVARAATTDQQCVFQLGVVVNCTSTNPAVVLNLASSAGTQSCTFGFILDWGDGSPTDSVTVSGTATTTGVLLGRHTYAQPGVYHLQAKTNGVTGPCTSGPGAYTFTLQSPGDQLTVSAGPDQVVTGTRTVQLAGTVSNPAATTAWRQLSGPAGSTTAFAAATPQTSATVSAPGTYVFELTATLGAAQASATVRVTFQPCAGPVGDPDHPDYCIPPDWNVHTVPGATLTGDEPLNLIISGRSTVTVQELQAALGRDAEPRWSPVQIGTGLPPKCISAETGNVAGTATPQALSWRQAGCVAGALLLAALGIENHARLWPQASTGAWFATASVEDLCLVGAKLYHCIVKNGYNYGRDSLVTAIRAAAARNGWTVTVRSDVRAAGTTSGIGANAGAGHGLRNRPSDRLGVEFEQYATVVTVTK